MAKLAVALALLALVAGASAKYHDETTMTKDGEVYTGLDMDGKEFPGRITHLYCYSDANGVVTGMAYKNEYTGYKTFCSRPDGGYYSANCVAPGCASFVLGALENIVKVEACRGGKYGYSSVTFWTDLNRNFTCGSASADYTPSDYTSYGKDYQSYKWGKDKHDKYGRHLLEDAAGADLDYYSKKGYGWGWESKCEVYEAPKKPEWADCGCGGCGSTCDPDWYKHGKGSDKYGYVQNKYGKSWTEYDSYYKHDGADGKKTHYYKDYDNYQKYETACGTTACDSKVDYYYRQVYPLAGFKVKCSKADDVYDVYKFKWNKKYFPPVPDNKLPITVTITLAPGITCADINDEQARENITAALEAVLGPLGVGIFVGPVTCTQEPGGNATLSVEVVLTPPPGMDVQTLIDLLVQNGITPGTDICTVNPAVCPPDLITSIVVSYGFPDFQRLQAMLVDSQFQAQIAKYVPLAQWAATGKITIRRN
ncbi:hypothetical protein HT031_002787 [Scenedesmus sp. PABB004]|nr:hypothetical protein HT031_002787 [Scenedesmus sp. PABB004]